MARPKGSKNKTPIVGETVKDEVEVEVSPVPMEPVPSPEPVKAKDAIMVETAGNYQLFDLMTNKVYAHDKPTKADPNNPFVKKELASGRLKEV